MTDGQLKKYTLMVRMLQWCNVIILSIWLFQAPELQAQVPPPVASWESARVLRIDVYEAGCLKAQPGGNNVACDFEGGHWWVRIPVLFNDQAINPIVPNRWYELRGVDGTTTLRRIEVPYNPFIMYFPVILVP